MAPVQPPPSLFSPFGAPDPHDASNSGRPPGTWVRRNFPKRAPRPTHFRHWWWRGTGVGKSMAPGCPRICPIDRHAYLLMAGKICLPLRSSQSSPSSVCGGGDRHNSSLAELAYPQTLLGSSLLCAAGPRHSPDLGRSVFPHVLVALLALGPKRVQSSAACHMTSDHEAARWITHAGARRCFGSSPVPSPAWQTGSAV